MNRTFEVVVVGGGLGGLATALALHQAGRRVCVIEQGGVLGGRAASQSPEPGYFLNQGPHAFYAGGEAERQLRVLGLQPRGKRALAEGALILDGDQAHTMPVGLLSLLTSGVLPVGDKLSFARLLGALPGLRAEAFDEISVDGWFARQKLSQRAAALARALVRLSTYVDAPADLSAGVAIRMLQAATQQGVSYLDGGWQQLVDAFEQKLRAGGVTMLTGSKAQRVVTSEGKVRGVLLENGELCRGPEVVIASGPRVVSRLLDEVPAASLLVRAAAAAVPITASCLDLALDHVPLPKRTFTLGLSRPTYCSLHSAVARLAPGSGGVIHAALYHAPGSSPDPALVREELRAVVARLQPGYEKRVVHERFLPRMVVMHDYAQARRGGLAGRTPGFSPRCPGVSLVGDWVGPEGHLLDAVLASSRAAATRLAGASMKAA